MVRGAGGEDNRDSGFGVSWVVPRRRLDFAPRRGTVAALNPQRWGGVVPKPSFDMKSG